MKDDELEKSLKKYEREIEYCSFCPKLCRFACPVAEALHSETLTPTSKMNILRLARDGIIEFNEEVADLVYKCSGCLLSRTYCEHRIEPISALEEARAVAVERGIAPFEVLELKESFERVGNPFGEELEVVLESILRKRTQLRSRVLLFLGCATIHYHHQVVRDMVYVLDKIGSTYQILNYRVCCGFPLYTLGHKKEFEMHRNRLMERLYRYNTIISPCPTCVYFLKKFYVGKDFKPEVLHHSQFFLKIIDELKLKAIEKRKVVWHDPCHLGRYLGEYDAPRTLLERVCEKQFMEFYDHEEKANCCGAGAGLDLLYPEIARSIADARLKEFEELRGEVLVSGCPRCEWIFESRGRDKGVQVLDIVNLVAKSL